MKETAEEQLRLLGASLAHRGSNHVARVLSYVDKDKEWRAMCSCEIELIFTLREMENAFIGLGNWVITRHPKFWYVTAMRAFLSEGT